MNQKLKATQDIITSLEKDSELSFNQFSKILVKQKINDDNFRKVQEKYKWIDIILKWVNIFTSLWNKTIDYHLKKNLYMVPTTLLQRIIYNWRWNSIENWMLFTIFQIKNWEEFIKKLFSYIDNIKSDETDTFSWTIQRRKVNTILQELREDYGKESFTFEIAIKKYFTDRICYYQMILGTPNLTIRNITIFEWIIRFSITMNNSEPIKDKEITWKEGQWFLYIYYAWREKKFKKWKNTYFIVKESLERWLNEYIDFAEMIDKLTWKKEQDKMKMVYNAVNYANNEIITELKIEGFFWVEEKAYKRQLEVIGT